MVSRKRDLNIHVFVKRERDRKLFPKRRDKAERQIKKVYKRKVGTDRMVEFVIKALEDGMNKVWTNGVQ